MIDTLKKLIKRIPGVKAVHKKWLFEREKKAFLLQPPNLRNYSYLARYLAYKDLEAVKDKPDLKKLHEQLDVFRQDQLEQWNSFVYCKGYYYQGYQRIGIQGIKPTEPRMDNYNISDFFNKEGKVLDIGCNSGFMACYLADHYKEVVGIELNPYLIRMGEAVKSHLGLNNLRFIEGNFIDHRFDEKFDAVFSLSNHFTIDGNLNIGFEEYIRKIYDIMNKGGILFFESHDINGDDSDLNEKFRIASRYFTLKKSKMVRSFYPADIDKLFAVFARKDEMLSHIPENVNFDLANIRNKYEYVLA